MTVRRFSLFPNGTAYSNARNGFLTSLDPVLPYGAINSFFDSVLGDTTSGPANTSRQLSFVPKLSIGESKGQIKVSSELPGVKLEDLEISLDKDLLTIKGEKKNALDATVEKHTYSSRKYGSFEHTIRLETPVYEDKIDAVLKDGILEVILTKKEAKESVRKIAVRTH